MTESAYLSVAEAAKACGVPERVIRGCIERGTLRSATLGGERVILRADLLDAGLLPIGQGERLETGDQDPSALPPARRKPKNAILGWFVIGALVLAGGDAMVGVDFLLDPLVPVVSLTLVAGLIFSRIRRGAFGKVWLLATAIIGTLIFFGAIGNAQGVDASGRTVGLSMLLPGVLALIARLRTRNTANETGVRRGRKSIGSGRKWLLAGIGAAVVVSIAAVIGFVAFSGGGAALAVLRLGSSNSVPVPSATCPAAVLKLRDLATTAANAQKGQTPSQIAPVSSALAIAQQALAECGDADPTAQGLAAASTALAAVNEALKGAQVTTWSSSLGVLPRDPLGSGEWLVPSGAFDYYDEIRAGTKSCSAYANIPAGDWGMIARGAVPPSGWKYLDTWCEAIRGDRDPPDQVIYRTESDPFLSGKAAMRIRSAGKQITALVNQAGFLARTT